MSAEKTDVIKSIREATFCVLIPDPNNHYFPTPRGTGFFISPNGYFITAAHVVNVVDVNDDKQIIELERPTNDFSVFVKNLKIINVWNEYDIALLKADLQENSKMSYFKDRKEFPYIDIDFNDHFEGEEVLTFGFPLPKAAVQDNENIKIGLIEFSPRFTSAIISSTVESFKPVRTSNDPKFYVIDKALNYGNSGGPVLIRSSNRAISICVRFQPQQMKDSGINVPSLYGITSSLQNIQSTLQKLI